jgi:hydroxymethylpyrimidine pyrophosphatase-like HAD family hydrolase
LQALYDKTMSMKDNIFPDMTLHLVTGREWKYVDAFSLNAHMRGYGPHIAENGGMIVKFGGPGKPDTEQYLVDAEVLMWIEPLQELLLEKLPKNTKIEGKKQTMLTLNAPDIDDIAQFAGMAMQIIKESEYADKVDYTHSKSGFDIMRKGHNRLVGVRYILDASNKHFETSAFFCNSTNDEPLLSQTGKSLVFTDAYAEKPIKDIVKSKRGVISDLPHGYATLDGIYRIFIHDIWHTRKSSPRIYKIHQ